MVLTVGVKPKRREESQLRARAATGEAMARGGKGRGGRTVDLSFDQSLPLLDERTKLVGGDVHLFRQFQRERVSLLPPPIHLSELERVDVHRGSW